MNFEKILKITCNIFGHSIIHPAVAFCTIWICGALVAFVTNEVHALNIDRSLDIASSIC